MAENIAARNEIPLISTVKILKLLSPPSEAAKCEFIKQPVGIKSLNLTPAGRKLPSHKLIIKLYSASGGISVEQMPDSRFRPFPPFARVDLSPEINHKDPPIARVFRAVPRALSSPPRLSRFE